MEDSVLQSIRENWSIIVTLVGLIWSYANLKGHVGQIHTRLSVVEKKVEEMSPIWQEIRERLARIETSLAIHFKGK